MFMFYRQSSVEIIVVLIYVDDIIVTSSNSVVIGKLLEQLHQQFALKDFGELAYFLGIHVTRQENRL